MKGLRDYYAKLALLADALVRLARGAAVEDRLFRKRVRFTCRACGRVFRRAAEEEGKPPAGNPGEQIYANLSANCCTCGELMTPYGTRHQGRVKRWKCAACGRMAETTGTAV